MAALEFSAAPTITRFVAAKASSSFIDDLFGQTFKTLQCAIIEMLPSRTERAQACGVVGRPVFGAVTDTEPEIFAIPTCGIIG